MQKVDHPNLNNEISEYDEKAELEKDVTETLKAFVSLKVTEISNAGYELGLNPRNSELKDIDSTLYKAFNTYIEEIRKYILDYLFTFDLHRKTSRFEIFEYFTILFLDLLIILKIQNPEIKKRYRQSINYIYLVEEIELFYTKVGEEQEIVKNWFDFSFNCKHETIEKLLKSPIEYPDLDLLLPEYKEYLLRNHRYLSIYDFDAFIEQFRWDLDSLFQNWDNEICQKAYKIDDDFDLPSVKDIDSNLSNELSSLEFELLNHGYEILGQTKAEERYKTKKLVLRFSSLFINLKIVLTVSNERLKKEFTAPYFGNVLTAKSLITIDKLSKSYNSNLLELWFDYCFGLDDDEFNKILEKNDYLSLNLNYYLKNIPKYLNDLNLTKSPISVTMKRPSDQYKITEEYFYTFEGDEENCRIIVTGSNLTEDHQYDFKGNRAKYTKSLFDNWANEKNKYLNKHEIAKIFPPNYCAPPSDVFKRGRAKDFKKKYIDSESRKGYYRLK